MAAPDLTSYDLLAPQLSGGKDSAVMMAVFMEAARASGVDDRVISYHSSLGVLEWPPVVFGGIRYPGVSKLAALQSAAFGVPAARHLEVTRTMPGPDGTRMPHSLLTEIAAYGRFPRMGSPYCRKSAKESVVSSAWTPIVNRLKRELGRPVRILKVMGLRSDDGPDRKKRAAFRTVQANSARIVDEWLPVKDWSTGAVKEWHADAPVPYCWTYDSVLGAGDWSGTSRCSCSLCVFAARTDVLLSIGRRPRLADLYAEVEQARGDSFHGLAYHRPDPACRAVRCARPRRRLPGRRPGVHRPRGAGTAGPEEGATQGTRTGTPRPSRTAGGVEPCVRPVRPQGATAEASRPGAPPAVLRPPRDR
ncbi:phosphoadenosine phosphosulfate reductase [Streptomyces sp. NPDC047009]|uniref:phosphoadenosine phosphosulfate reductase n=1 Tax=Streptomyces sp. NPDC047009 TaxID=3154496 RepID=UPI0034116EF7